MNLLKHFIYRNFYNHLQKQTYTNQNTYQDIILLTNSKKNILYSLYLLYIACEIQKITQNV